jgi:hypothetical protein
MLSLLVTVLIVCLIAGVIIWAIGLIPLPNPIGLIVRVVVCLIVAIYLLELLLGSGGLSLGSHPLN